MVQTAPEYQTVSLAGRGGVGGTSFLIFNYVKVEQTQHSLRQLVTSKYHSLHVTLARCLLYTLRAYEGERYQRQVPADYWLEDRLLLL